MYPANPVFVDNDDSRITYTDPSAAREEDQLSSRALELVQSINSTYGGTLAVTTEPGLSFELIFYGRILQIYGAVIPWPINELPRAEYTIDDDGDFEFVPSGTSATSNVTFYVSTLLPLTFHTLTVKVLNATVDAPFLFDYIVYGFLDASEDPNPPNAGSSTSGLASQAQSSPAGTTSTSTPPTLASVSGPAISSSGSATVSPPTIAPDATSVPDRSARSFPTGPVVGVRKDEELPTANPSNQLLTAPVRHSVACL
ncbi:hypothetical protein C8Q77DRAFT_1162518 [Trametes polyzona]|nr:hypothetical protein C8Q77DRAFT_1162518 [Trametes polyzona]